MKITFEKDRIRWQSENEDESEAIYALSEFIGFSCVLDDIANDHGCCGKLNYCCIPLPLDEEEFNQACDACRN